jgi:tRNA modification GTPase
MRKHPIAAIATPPGSGGVSIIRVSGQQLVGLAEVLLAKPPTTRYAHHLFLNDAQGNRLDEALLIFFKGPASFTGEDVIELHCHGGAHLSQAILNRVLELGNDWGIKQAEAGEFSLRAYLNGKIDLVQAEAIADLINAQSDAAIKGAARSLRGQFSDSVNQLIEEITQLRILVESTFDFPEEEIEFLESSKANERLAELSNKIHELVRRDAARKNPARRNTACARGFAQCWQKLIIKLPLWAKSVRLLPPWQAPPATGFKRASPYRECPVHLLTPRASGRLLIWLSSLELQKHGMQFKMRTRLFICATFQQAESPEESRLEEKVTKRASKKAHIINVFNKLDLLDTAKLFGHSPHDESAIYISVKTGAGLDRLRKRILEV